MLTKRRDIIIEILISSFKINQPNITPKIGAKKLKDAIDEAG